MQAVKVTVRDTFCQSLEEGNMGQEERSGSELRPIQYCSYYCSDHHGDRALQKHFLSKTKGHNCFFLALKHGCTGIGDGDNGELFVAEDLYFEALRNLRMSTVKCITTCLSLFENK
jgi:hypothetical protein